MCVVPTGAGSVTAAIAPRPTASPQPSLQVSQMVNVHALQAQRDVWARLADSRGFIGEIARKKLAHIDTTLGTNDRTPAPPPPPPTLGPQIATTKTGADALRTVPLQIVPR